MCRLSELYWSYNECVNQCTEDGKFLVANSCDTKADVATSPELWDVKFTFSDI